MAEPATTPRHGPSHERDALLATKLHLPRPRPGLVARPRLLQRLTEGMGRELVLVCTPAGFGKTTLLAEWARAGQRPVAWLSLDDGGQRPGAVLAPCRRRPGPGAARARRAGDRAARIATGLLRGPGDRAGQRAGGADRGGRAGAGRLPPDPGAGGPCLGRVPARAPAASLRLVLASRADPPCRWPGCGPAASWPSCARPTCASPPRRPASCWRPRSGPSCRRWPWPPWGTGPKAGRPGCSWPPCRCRAAATSAEFVEGFSGSHRYVLDYLTEEVLDRQPEQLRTFLLETSVLERLCGRCAKRSPAGRQPAAAGAGRAGQPVPVPLDDVRGWWRYHHLFADLLRARLQRERPERVPELHRAAAGWCERHGLVDEAIRHARAAGDLTWAARLVEQHFEAVVGRREDATLRRWLEALPAEVVRSRPRLCLLQAFWALIGSRVEAVERLLDEAERRSRMPATSRTSRLVGRAASLVANIPAAIARMRAGVAHLRGDAEQTTAFARRALAELDEGEWMLESVTRWQLIGAEWLRGQPAEAERGFLSSRLQPRRLARDRPADPGRVGLRPPGPGPARPGPARRGAREPTRRRWRLTAEPGRPAMPAAGVAYVGMAEVAYERDELDAALDHATQGVALARQLGWTLPLVAGLTILARIRQAQGDPPPPWRRSGRPSRSSRATRWSACWTPCRPVRAGWPWPTAGSTPPPAGIRQRGLGRRGPSPATRASASTWSWRGCCSPSRHPNGRSACWNAGPPWPRPRGGPRAASSSRRCRRWPMRPAATSRRGAGCSGGGAHARRPRGLPAGVRRRGPADGRPAPAPAGTAGQGPGGGRRPRPATTWSAWSRPSSIKA